MTSLGSQVRIGAYHDSIVLMQLQVALADLPGVLDAGAVMGTPENLALLDASGLLPEDLPPVSPGDLVVVVRADSREKAVDALGQVDALLARSGVDHEQDFRPRSLASAAKLAPDATWVLVSVPGRFAADVAREALELGRHVFVYSDNVSLADEVSLKADARRRGLLVMGPDCGTAIIGGVGFGFANRVRRGTIGLIGASGTGLQAITARIHALGAGVSHAIGTGGRDLQARVGGATALQGLDLLARDPDTRVIVLVSKPPDPGVVRTLLSAAGEAGKPVVVDFLGYPPPARRVGGVHFASSLDEAATMAVEILAADEAQERDEAAPAVTDAGGPHGGYLRGLFSGGTLALEVLHGLRAYLDPLHSNIEAEGVRSLSDAARSEGHTILDLGSDEFTVGRPHPMIDSDLRLRRLRQEADDPEVGLVLVDLVLGHGAHPDPAGELAPAIEAVRAERKLEFVVLVVGTDEDPQDLGSQVERLRRAGAHVCHGAGDVVTHAARHFRRRPIDRAPPVSLEVLRTPAAAINVGLEILSDALISQATRVVQVDWRPPAGENERLMGILKKMGR